MNIEIRLFASLAPFAQNPLVSANGTMALDSPATIRDAVTRLGVPEDNIKLVFKNGVHASLDSDLGEGDRVGIFPPIGGG
jgi:sulfur-carrier protein